MAGLISLTVTFRTEEINEGDDKHLFSCWVITANSNVNLVDIKLVSDRKVRKMAS